MPRKRTQKAMKNEADDLFRKIIRSRGACEACGDTYYPNLQTAHIISRSYGLIRCDERNAFCLCARDHRLFTSDPVSFGKFVISKIGEDGYQELLELRRPTDRKIDWAPVVERLRQRWAEIEGMAA